MEKPTTSGIAAQQAPDTEQPPRKMARTALFASYDRRRQHSSQGVAAPVSPMTVATAFADKMLSIASQDLCGRGLLGVGAAC